MSEGDKAKAVRSSVASSTTTTTTTATATGTSTTSGSTLDSRDVTESSPPPPPPPPPPPLPPPPKSSTKNPNALRKHKKQHVFHHNRYNLYDGKKIRSALIHKKWPPKPRRVIFPTSDNDLVTGYLEPANPWEHAENVNIEGLISSYKKSCERHCIQPLQNVLSLLEKLDISDDERCAEFCLKNESLNQWNCEPLEEILKRVQFEKIDLEAASLDDESAVILFDMIEYYQSARHLNMSNNRNIGSRGWQACAYMIKKTTCLEQLEARDIILTQQHMNILKRPLQLVAHLHILKLENCGLAGGAFAILVSALKSNTGIKELYLADNGLEQEDAIQLGALLRVNSHLQLLDISNNHIKDEGVHDLLDGLITQSNDDRRGKGLSILVLWNNDLTKSSAAHFAQAIAQSITLETLNIGKNAVSNELLEWSEDALVKSNTLLQLGMQSTNLTCKGALVLAEVLEKNRVLQRIDLRDNNIQMEGLAALSFAMKRNTSVTQMDLDDNPWSTTPATMSQYLDHVAEIRGYCVRNDEPTSIDDSTEESSSPQHRSRLSSVSSRKISLTCQTLPRSPPSMTTQSSNEITNRAMLEPKRTSGRLRSPAPSPIPSPVASPIPSPSRGRFVVSRVSEASLSSTNSSASSSPVTPPSLASSPTCFFPSTGGRSSRFRVVTVVEPTVPAAKSVVTSTNANVTIGFNYRVQTPESNDSDDSDSVFRSDVDDDNRAAGNESSASIDIDVSFEEEAKTVCAVKSLKTETSVEQSHTKIETVEEITAAMLSKKENPEVDDNQTDDEVKEAVRKTENGQTADDTAIVEETREEDRTEELQELAREETRDTDRVESGIIIETKVNSDNRTEESLRDEIIASYEPEPKKPEPVQRQATSLERLLGLFHHPGSIFSGSSFVERTEAKNPLQDGVNSMIALGDKFQQYLRDGRGSAKSGSDDSPIHAALQRSVSDASRSTIKLDPVKSLSIPQLSSIQTTCTRDFASYREPTKVTTENPACNFQLARTTSESTNAQSRKIFVVDESPPNSCPISGEKEVSRISDDLPLPENVQSLADTIDEDGDATSNISPIEPASPERSRDSSSTDNVNTATSSTVDESKTTTCAPKLKDIPEYSVLEIRGSLVDKSTSDNDESSSRNKKFEKTPDDDDAVTKCDSSTTDSINDPSCKLSSLCKVTCDISGVDDVHTSSSSSAGDVHNFFNSPLNHDGDNILDEASSKESATTITGSSSESAVESIEEIIIVEQKDLENLGNSIVNENKKDEEVAKKEEEEEEEEDEAANQAEAPSKDIRSIVAINVDLSLPVLNNLCINHPIDAEAIDDAQGERIPGRRYDDDTSVTTGDTEFSDTVEEFLPIDAAVAASSLLDSTVLSRRHATPVSSNSLINDNSYPGDPVTTIKQELEPTTGQVRPENITVTDKKIPLFDGIAVEDAIAIPDRVSVPIANCTTNDLTGSKIEIASVEYYDYGPAGIEQVSTSLSEDSDYSSKLSVDDVRIGEQSSIDSTANSPAHDRIEQVVAETNNSLDRMNVCSNETTSKSTDHRSFVRLAVDSVFTSLLSVTESAPRVSTAEIKNSESTEDLMFRMTDIITEASSNVGEGTIGSVVETIEERGDSSSLMNALFETGQSSRSPTNSFTDKSRKVHRNSQDSGIEEATVSISEDSGLEGNGQQRESFQESVDSGIDSECSSVCARVDVGADVQKERARDPGKASDYDAIVNDEIRLSAGSHAAKGEVLVTDEISRIVNVPIYKSVIVDDKSSSKLAEVIGVGRSAETTSDRPNVVASSTSPE